MGNFKTENLELLQIQKQIITNYGDDVKSKFIIGDALMKAKEHCESDTQSTKEADTMFENLVNTLPFGKVVANKYIAIAKTDFLRKLSEDDTTVGNLPSGYNNLFSYTKEVIKNDEKVVAKLTDLFTKGKLKGGKSTSQASFQKVMSEIKGDDNDTKEVLKSLGTLKVKESLIKSQETFESVELTYANFLKVQELVNHIKELAECVDILELDGFSQTTMDSMEKSSTKVKSELEVEFGKAKLKDIKSTAESNHELTIPSPIAHAFEDAA
jgi:hypothetical protein